MADTKQTRNIRDTLILSGQLARAATNGGVYPEAADWEDATGKIRFFEDTRAKEFVSEADATITPPSGDTQARYRHVGAIGAVPIGRYFYKIHVTFTDATELTWPNDNEKYQLEIVDEDVT